MQPKIRILHVIKSLGRGGAEMLLPETLRLHDKTAFDFHYIYFLPWKDAMVKSIVDVGGKVTCIPANNNIQLLLRANRVAKYVQENEISVIHAHLPWAGVVARIAARITRRPVLYTEHNKLERYHFVTRLLNLLTMNWLTKLIAVSDDVAKSVRKYKPRLQIPVQTILNGVNTARFSPGGDEVDARENLGIPNNSPVIGTIAVFRTQKRLDIWLEIAKDILSQIPDVHFIIVGAGPLATEIETKREELGLVERVHLVGSQSEVRPFLKAFDLYMMSSIFEGLPIALLEAMASGCPAVCTDAGGIKEVITHGVDGYLCPVEKPSELVDFAVRLLQNSEERTTLGHNARRKIEECFSMRRMIDELEKCYYAEVLDRSKCGAHELR